jgi:hypothetical protein
MSTGFYRLGANVDPTTANARLISIILGSQQGLSALPVVSAPVVVEPAGAPDIKITPAEFAALTDVGPPKLGKHEARLSGYTGDECITCGSARMRRNGTCLVCESCGATTGCS